MKYILPLLFIVTSIYANPDADWRATLYRARATDGHFVNIARLEKGKIQNYYLTCFSLAKKIAQFKHYFTYEFEGQIAHHDEILFAQEINGMFVGRYHAFFWDPIIDTSLAFGGGFSYALTVAEFETEKNDINSNLLHALVLELTFALPQFKDWSLITRIHHRSGFWGLIGNVWGGSNYLALGIQHTF